MRFGPTTSIHHWAFLATDSHHWNRIRLTASFYEPITLTEEVRKWKDGVLEAPQTQQDADGS